MDLAPRRRHKPAGPRPTTRSGSRGQAARNPIDVEGDEEQHSEAASSGDAETADEECSTSASPQRAKLQDTRRASKRARPTVSDASRRMESKVARIGGDEEAGRASSPRTESDSEPDKMGVAASPNGSVSCPQAARADLEGLLGGRSPSAVEHRAVHDVSQYAIDDEEEEEEEEEEVQNSETQNTLAAAAAAVVDPGGDEGAPQSLTGERSSLLPICLPDEDKDTDSELDVEVQEKGPQPVLWVLIAVKHFGPARSEVLGIHEPWDHAMQLCGAYRTKDEADKARKLRAANLGSRGESRADGQDKHGHLVDFLVRSVQPMTF